MFMLPLIACSPLPTASRVPTLMPLGDSITQGSFADSVGGYRGPLVTAIGSRYVFVGSQSSGAIDQPAHEGHPGYYIKGYTSNGTYGQGLLENVPLWIPIHPDVILLHIGTNTLAANYPNANAATNAASDLTELLTAIRAYSPLSKVYVASIIPLDHSHNSLTESQFTQFQNAISAYNALVPGIVSGFSNMQFVDMATLAGLTSSDFADMAHPNATGYAKMATVWVNAGL